MRQNCEKCGGLYVLKEQQGTIETYECKGCGDTYVTRVICAEEPYNSSVETYSVEVQFNESLNGKKALLKFKKVFKGLPNFDLSDFISKVENGCEQIDMGFYSKQELEIILERASGFEESVVANRV